MIRKQPATKLLMSSLVASCFALLGAAYADTNDQPKPLATEFQIQIISEGQIDKDADLPLESNRPPSVTEKVNPETNDPPTQALHRADPKVVRNAINNRFRDYSSDTSDGVQLVLQISNDFALYKDDVVELAKDSVAPQNARLMMLEVMRHNWADPTARSGLAAVFEQEPLSSPVAAYAALHMARHNQDALWMGNRIQKNYDQLDKSVRPLYLTVLARLQNVDSLALVHERFMNSNDPSELVAAAEALGRLAEPDQLTIIDDLSNAAAEFGQAGHPSPLGPSGEVLAMRATEALGRINGQEAIDRLLDIAANEELTTDVRMSAVESFARFSHISDVTTDRLNLIDEAFQSSIRSSTDKRRFSMMVERALITRTRDH